MIEHLGDMFMSDADAFAHGVNTSGVMGAGVAKYVAQYWPELYTDYRALCSRKDLEPGEVFVYELNDGRYVFNMATQDLPGPNARLDWIKESAEASIAYAERLGITHIAAPRIGSGIGGLNWVDVRGILLETETERVQWEIWAL